MWRSAAFCCVTTAIALMTCAAPSPRTRAPSAHFESHLMPDEDPLDFDATAAPAPDNSLTTPPAERDDVRQAEAACASISRTASVGFAEIPGGARLILTPYHRSDLERLLRNVYALEYAKDIEGCSLPGILRDAADVEIYVVKERVRIDLGALRGQQTELRHRAAGFAREVAAFGLASPWSPGQ